MDLKKIDLDKLQDYAFTPYELAMTEEVQNQKFINIKCLNNESLIPTVKAIPLDCIKQAREYIENDMDLDDYLEILQEIGCTGEEVRVSRKFAVTVLDSLISESEG